MMAYPTSKDIVTLIQKGEYRNAFVEIRSLMAITERPRDNLLYNASAVLMMQGDYAGAKRLCRQILGSNHVDRQVQFRCRFSMSFMSCQQGRYTSALTSIDLADAIRPDHRYDSVVLHEKAYIHLLRGEVGKSINLFRRAIRLNEKKPPDLGQIRLRRNKRGLAQALAYSGDVKAGLDLVRSIDQPEDQKPSLAYQHLITGELLLLDYQPEEALKHIDQGCEIIDEMSALGMGAACRRLRAECLLAIGRHDEAKMEARAAYSWSYKLTERHEMGRELLILADIAAAEGDYRSAEKKHFRAAQILEKIGSSWVLVHYHNRKVG